MPPAPPTVLAIAGSDPSGGAGLEADQRVLALHGCYALTATTALTVQNTRGVRAVHVAPPEFLRDQLEAVLEDVSIDVVKIGMLACRESVGVVGDLLGRWREGERGSGRAAGLVLDPVMVSTSGHRLLPEDAIQGLKERLLPLATVLTPNIPEAMLLVNDFEKEGGLPNGLDELEDLARRVHALGSEAVLLKGGHIPLSLAYKRTKNGETPALIVDVLYDGKNLTKIESVYSPSRNTHGTGCSLASAVAANLAHGKSLHAAVRDACRYVERGIKTSFELGHGNGPINHFHSLQVLPFSPGHFIEYLLERADVQPLWKAFTQHAFVRGIGDGSLPLDVFKRFLIQDYLYLTQFARTTALAAYKSGDIDDIAASAQIVLGVQKEMALHLEYCQEFGIGKVEVEGNKESQATVAYSRYVLDIGQSGDWLGLQMAMASCLIGYQIAAKWVKMQPGSKSEGTRYWKWVESYEGEAYAQSVRLGLEMIERHAAKISPQRVEELVRIFIRVTEMEIKFWDFDAHLQ